MLVGVSGAIKCFDCDSEFVVGCSSDEFDWYETDTKEGCDYCQVCMT